MTDKGSCPWLATPGLVLRSALLIRTYTVLLRTRTGSVLALPVLSLPVTTWQADVSAVVTKQLPWLLSKRRPAEASFWVSLVGLPRGSQLEATASLCCILALVVSVIFCRRYRDLVRVYGVVLHTMYTLVTRILRSPYVAVVQSTTRYDVFQRVQVGRNHESS